MGMSCAGGWGVRPGVVVLGVFRSGTSVTCAMLAQLGVDFGPEDTLMGPEPENPLGYFQQRPLRGLNQRLIQSVVGDDPMPPHPQQVLASGQLELLAGADMGWRRDGRLWGLKDPRLCSTLLAFIESGLIDVNGLRLVHVTRDIEAVVRSGMNFHVIRDLAGGSPDKVRRMIERYEDHARWHIQHLGVPTLEVRYERLITDPLTVAEELGDFIGTTSRRAIRHARAQVGVRRARTLWRVRQRLAAIPPIRLAVRAVRQLWRMARMPHRGSAAAPPR